MDKILSNDIQKDHQEYVLTSWSKQLGILPKVMTKAEGVFFWDEQGRKYFDMSSQLVYTNVGHQHPKLLEAFKHIGEIPLSSPGFASASKSALAKKIIELAPNNMQKVFFTCGGAESNDHAIKIAKMVTGRYKIFSRYRSYHGATFGAGNLTGENRRLSAEPGIPGFVKFDIPYLYREAIDFSSEEQATEFYLKRLQQQILYEGPNMIAAIFIEPIPGSNGVIIPPKGYLEGVRTLCDEFGILMVCDEVMSGFGRTGKMFAVDHYDFEPDMITFAKGITSGYAPLGGVIVSNQIASYFDDHPLMTGLTYSGHTMCTQIGLETLKIYEEEKLIDNAYKVGKVLAERLEQLLSYSIVGEVRHLGLFAAVELVKDKTTREPLIQYGLDYGQDPVRLMNKFISMLLKKGFYTYSHESSIIIAPPLVITVDELNEAMDIFENVIQEFEKLINQPKFASV
ncbi:aminotransferase class III-fold pyridoxal phosphate-dependent enzyme [Rummeliibacillus sp. TYF005]|uniref:aminotransferase class III-fold pyridoxal phosphate-dependent enzyme n=1 Tax=unclassified Rummeliibacillus TaxID=2622809 RepID=UPI000E66522E|nr:MULTISPECIES: aminotransferase class III-fold pyridoxal phosphate-dependent enzyme [unclassified Rummeliibacillus]RIJ63818.1 aminotransferase class III-fold pyridoxal phosphate-dependent enzyme [Rummeliibacillus sp. POC4]RPJ95573.1 aminotransferase class III-fold pyridoxal phosphate-dependent enzyme [Rummeliibacillus sp. TYF005]